MTIPGRFVRDPRGYRYFVPSPLPPRVAWEPGLLNLLSEADRRIGRLAGEGRRLPNPHLLVRPFVRREAVDSSRIEGAQATLGELLAAEAGAAVDRSPADLREVGNYVVAIETVLGRPRRPRITLALVRELHRILMTGEHGANASPGRFRDVQNWIGPPLSTVRTASYVPPSPGEMRACLLEWQRSVDDRGLPPLVHLAMLHYQFEAIHPFLDGNGRVGRLLIVLFLVLHDILPSPLLYLSAYFDATRAAYHARLRAVSDTGDWGSWLRYFLKGVEIQAGDALNRAGRIDALLRRWGEEAARSGLGADRRLIDFVAINPFLTVKRAAAHLGVAFTTAQRAVERLAKRSVLREVSGGRRDRVYCAKELLAILEEPPSLPENLADLV